MDHVKLEMIREDFKKVVPIVPDFPEKTPKSNSVSEFLKNTIETVDKTIKFGINQILNVKSDIPLMSNIYSGFNGLNVKVRLTILPVEPLDKQLGSKPTPEGFLKFLKAIGGFPIPEDCDGDCENCDDAEQIF